VDRIDVLRVLERTDADRALDPPRREAPWSPPETHTPLTTDACLALLDAALLLTTLVPAPADWPRDEHGRRANLPPTGHWPVLRDVLLSDPAAREALGQAAADAAAPERAWLARAWRQRLENTERWSDLETSLGSVLQHALTPPPWRGHARGTHARRSEADLATGSAAVRIESLVPKHLAEDFRWLKGPGDPGGQLRGGLFHGVDGEGLEVVLPASPLWSSIFAETWLLSWRGPLPSPGREGAKRSPPVVPSTVGVLRLHALQQLAWLGESRVLPALKALAVDAAATPEERAVAARLLTAFPN
jgi:hypothetical protein